MSAREAELKKKIDDMTFLIYTVVALSTIFIFGMCAVAAHGIDEKNKHIAELEQQNALVPLDDFWVFDEPRTLTWTAWEDGELVNKSVTSRVFNKEKIYEIYYYYDYGVFYANNSISVKIQDSSVIGHDDMIYVSETLLFIAEHQRQNIFKLPLIGYFFDMFRLDAVKKFGRIFSENEGRIEMINFSKNIYAHPDFMNVFIPLSAIFFISFISYIVVDHMKDKKKRAKKVNHSGDVLSVVPITKNHFRVVKNEVTENAIDVPHFCNVFKNGKLSVFNFDTAHQVPRTIRRFVVSKEFDNCTVYVKADVSLVTDADVIFALTMCRGMDRFEPLERALAKYAVPEKGKWVYTPYVENVSILNKTGFTVRHVVVTVVPKLNPCS